MAFSTQRAVSDGTMAYLDISIQYIKRADIGVFYDGLPAGAGTWAWVGTTDKRISFTPNVPNGVEVLIKRTTQIDGIINVFSLGAKFNNSTMDQDFTQLLYLNQEAVEGAALTDIFNDVDFHGYKIKNLGTAVDANDAITYGQVQTMSNGAYTAQLAAQAAQAASEAARDLAQKWASQLTTTVDGTSYSAKQYALNASTSATAAAGSASAASGSASAASSSAGAASASAGNAATSEANALTYKNAAQTSATNAATSETNAAASAALAASNAASAGGFRFSGRKSLSAGATLVVGDNGSIVEVTSATPVTVTMFSHASFPNANAMQIVNLGTADVTVQNGSGTFNNGGSITSFVIPAKQNVILVGTGGTVVDLVSGAPVDGVYATAQGALQKSDNLAALTNKATARANLGVGRTLLKTVTVSNVASVVFTDTDFGTTVYDSVEVEIIGLTCSLAGGGLYWKVAPNSDGSGSTNSYSGTTGYSYWNDSSTHGTGEAAVDAINAAKFVYAATGTGAISNGSARLTVSNLKQRLALGPISRSEFYTLDSNSAFIQGHGGHIYRATPLTVRYLALVPDSGTFSCVVSLYGILN